MDNEIKDFIQVPTLKTRRWRAVSILLILVGGVAFWIGVSGPHAQRTWQAYLINFVFWSGLSFGSVLFVAVLNLTSARWGRPLKRLAESLGSCSIPFFALFWVLYFGCDKIFPWIEEPLSGKQMWLNIPFLFARDGVALFLLTAVSMALIYFSIRGDERAWRYQTILSPILGILYCFVLTLVSFDLIMSLDPHWANTLFGGYYFVGSFYTALCGIVVLAALAHKKLGLRRIIRPRHFHDLGKLLFGFCMMTGYLFYTQFLVIWYGNLPEETRYVILRVRHSPWEPVAWIVFAICFGLPFILLLGRKIKMHPGPLTILSLIILIGMWLERFLLVAPSLWEKPEIPLGAIEVLVTAGFLGVVGLTVTLFLTRFPLLPLSDPLFHEEMKAMAAEVRE